MLELQLTLQNNQVNVKINSRESHIFSLLDVGQTENEWKDFFKNPRPYGTKLFEALFKDGSPAQVEFNLLSKQSERTIMLVLESPELDGVAWEYAYNKAKEEYVVEDCAFVRALPEAERPANRRMKNEMERVPLLFIPANPLVDLNGEPMRALDVEGEWREMKRLIEKSNAPFNMLELRPATPKALQSVMARFQNGMIAHFSGHGAATKDGAILLFERENGASNPLEAREFVREIKDKAWIGFLSACQSATPERTEFSNLARELAKAGVSFALGMQFNLPDPFAPNISGQFYNYLAHGHAVPEAAQQARRAVKRENEFFVGMIALYAAHPDEVGRIIWHGSGAQTHDLFRPADVSDLPSPASGLIGRQRELMRIGSRLLEGKKPLTVTLHGAGGIGKTALLWQALLRFAPSFELTLAIGLDPLPSLESVLGRIERFLLVPSPCANDTKERETLVRNALTSKRTLLGLDNFETLNYALNEKRSDEEKTAKSLHAFFRSLAANGATLCVTSREVTNLPGEIVEDIQGLSNESGGRLFQENVVRQKNEIYIERTQQVSEMVGGHPLALRLLASVFDDQVGTTLDQYIESLQSFLPKARDKWTEEDRHESLRASFDFTMNNMLKTEQGRHLQASLTRLSIFTAFFAELTAAPVLENRIPENNEDFQKMRPKTSSTLNMLWERSLLERIVIPLVKENYGLYRLPSVLRLFAQEQLTEVEEAKETCWQSLNNLARIAAEQIKSDALIAQISWGALPDLLTAAKLKVSEDALTMQYRLSAVLEWFGLYDEALRLLANVLDAYTARNQNRGISLAWHAMARIYAKRGDLEAAMRLNKNALSLLKDINDPQTEGRILHEIAGICVTWGDLDEAMGLYKQSLAINERLGDLRGKSSNLRGIATILTNKGDLNSALSTYQATLDIANQLGDAGGISSSLHNMAVIHTTRGDIDKAIEFCQQALGIEESLHFAEGKSATLHQMALIHRIRGDLDNAIRFSEEVLRIQEGLGKLDSISAGLHELANIHFARGNLDRAMQLNQRALGIATKLGDLRGKSMDLLNIAQIHSKRGDFAKAMQLYKQVLEINEDLADLQGKSDTLQAMATTCIEQEDLEQAMSLYRKSLEIKESLRDQHGKSTILNNIGVLMFRKGNYEEALKSLLSALEINIRLKAKTDIERVVSLLNQLMQEIGFDEFRKLWRETTGSEQLPDWLEQTPEEEQGMTIEQFIAGAIQSAREKRPEAEEYFKSAQKMAADSSAPKEVHELGKVLQRIMAGGKNVDLSSLPREMAEWIHAALQQ